MEQFFQDLASTYWWLILLVGLVVGIAGTFMADGIKKLYGSISSRQRKRNTEREKENEKETEYLVIHPEEIADYQFLATQSDLRATRYFILAFMLLIAAYPREETPPLMQYILLLFAGFPYYVSLRGLSRRNRYSNISWEARKRLRDRMEIVEIEEETPNNRTT